MYLCQIYLKVICVFRSRQHSKEKTRMNYFSLLEVVASSRFPSLITSVIVTAPMISRTLPNLYSQATLSSFGRWMAVKFRVIPGPARTILFSFFPLLTTRGFYSHVIFLIFCIPRADPGRLLRYKGHIGDESSQSPMSLLQRRSAIMLSARVISIPISHKVPTY